MKIFKPAVVETAAPAMTPVQEAIAASPSRQELSAAEQCVRDLAKQRADVEDEIVRLTKELDRRAKPNSLANDLLANKLIVSDEKENALLSARRTLAAIDDALRLTDFRVVTARRSLSHEVNVALRPSRQQLVTRIAAALGELRKACREEDALRAELAQAGIDCESVVFWPVSSVCDHDLVWLAERRKQGFAV